MNKQLVLPSTLIHDIQIEEIDCVPIFKFSAPLQIRMETLLDKKRITSLTSDEASELEAIGEMDRIFTHTNAMLAAQHENPHF